MPDFLSFRLHKPHWLVEFHFPIHQYHWLEAQPLTFIFFLQKFHDLSPFCGQTFCGTFCLFTDFKFKMFEIIVLFFIWMNIFYMPVKDTVFVPSSEVVTMLYGSIIYVFTFSNVHSSDIFLSTYVTGDFISGISGPTIIIGSWVGGRLANVTFISRARTPHPGVFGVLCQPFHLSSDHLLYHYFFPWYLFLYSWLYISC